MCFSVHCLTFRLCTAPKKHVWHKFCSREFPCPSCSTPENWLLASFLHLYSICLPASDSKPLSLAQVYSSKGQCSLRNLQLFISESAFAKYEGKGKADPAPSLHVRTLHRPPTARSRNTSSVSELQRVEERRRRDRGAGETDPQYLTKPLP